ncbi:MAG TPA: MarR family winged helix-turn-helix transcriptional regulator [Burkholderiaceae bacterium]|jgi:DNA-binding MarR family transcriptional regulator
MSARSQCACSKLRQLTRKLSNIYDHHLAPDGLTIGQYAFLARIGKYGPIGVIPLAADFGMDRSTISRGLKPLIAEGWVETVDDLPLEMLTDKRSFGVCLSATGVRKWKAAMPRWQKAQEEIAVILGGTNLRQLIDLVDDANLKFEQLDMAA